jgi:hypothetical protein
MVIANSLRKTFASVLCVLTQMPLAAWSTCFLLILGLQGHWHCHLLQLLTCAAALLLTCVTAELVHSLPVLRQGPGVFHGTIE